GSTKVQPEPDKKDVIRPDVAYIMNDIMKDIINRGTAAQAQGWGFKNVDGKTAFAGKTGTSRDGWFAGFTPELVTVVYVGFDDNDDLGMKGSDSAMPIWADFMKAALERHPDWNGDWAMPAGVRKAEIDIRNGSLVRELDGLAATPAKAEPSPTATPVDAYKDDPDWAVPETPVPTEVFVTNVPDEFRRVELFIGGTIPNRRLLDETEILGSDVAIPEATPTPLDGTWEERGNSNSARESVPVEENSNRSRRDQYERSRITVSVCPLTGMRASINCPVREPRSFVKGSEPRDFCDIHR
ncbi:MAG: penicillin-binding transpeptidase domain-containing protein, partial [Pyrinomonadaceae bacterium]|nr:penicillin-binding transpeptidase domain-containing protein [Pyrinomonadaceae bacterium]